jgi:hypothetical protein
MAQPQPQPQAQAKEVLSLNNKQVANLATFFKNTCKHNSLNPFLLPISKIDGIPVQVVFTYEGERANAHDIIYLACTIYLEPNIEYSMAEFFVRDFDADFTLECGIIILLKKLNTLYFNKFKGVIETKTSSDNGSGHGQADVMLDLYNIITTFENITPSVPECCVCYEITETHTSCKHQICIACYSQLEVVKEGSSEYRNRKTQMKNCPLCRSLITKLLPEVNRHERLTYE